MKPLDTWLSQEDKQISQMPITSSFLYNAKLVSNFPTKSFRDFEPDDELKLERALIRYSDEDLTSYDGDKLYRLLFDHP